MPEAFEEYYSKAEELYYTAENTQRETGVCIAKPLPRVSYHELREAFLPTRTKETVQRVGDKILQSALELFANSEIFSYNMEPSCRALGLADMDDLESHCYFMPDARVKGKHMLVCDCPKGYADYDAKSYAKEHVVKCKGDEPEMHYSDYPEGLSKGAIQYQSARKTGDVSGMVLGADRMVNAVHGSGAIADFFVVSGKRTLDRLAGVAV